MRPQYSRFFLPILALGLIFTAFSPAQAQVAIGAHASINDVGGATWGIGGRVGVVLKQTYDLTIALEGVGDYYFPPCDVLECDAYGFQANLMARRGLTSYAEGYLGIGVIWEDFSLESDQDRFEGDDIGFNFLVGTQGGQPGSVRPFVDVRISFFDDLQNQIGVSFGLRVPITGR